MPNNAFYQQDIVSDIIGREPAWIIRSGISLITIITLTLFFITWFIQYPDNIKAPITLQTSQTLVIHRARLDGYLDQILVTDGQQVKRDQPLALIESRLNLSLLIQLENILIRHANSTQLQLLVDDIAALVPTDQLGELQTTFNQLNKSLRKWHHIKEGKPIQHNQYSTKELVEKYQKLIDELKQKLQTILQQVGLTQTEIEQKQALVDKRLFASVQLIEVKQRHLNQRSKLSDIRINIKLYQVKISELRQNLTTNQISRQENLEHSEADVEGQRLLLLSQIRKWKQKHLLVAKINGEVSFNQAWKHHQFVHLDDTMFSIAPANQQMEAWMKVSGNGVGKIKPGQRVHIELENYLPAEFGLIEGLVSSINTIPDEKGYLVKLTLPKQLTSSYGIVLKGHPYLRGTGKIITRPRRLLSRFTDKINYAFDQIGRN